MVTFRFVKKENEIPVKGTWNDVTPKGEKIQDIDKENFEKSFQDIQTIEKSSKDEDFEKSRTLGAKDKQKRKKKELDEQYKKYDQGKLTGKESYNLAQKLIRHEDDRGYDILGDKQRGESSGRGIKKSSDEDFDAVKNNKGTGIVYDSEMNSNESAYIKEEENTNFPTGKIRKENKVSVADDDMEKSRILGAKDKQKRKRKIGDILNILKRKFGTKVSKMDPASIDEYLVTRGVSRSIAEKITHKFIETMEDISSLKDEDFAVRRKHTPIVSEAQRRLFGAVAGGAKTAAEGLSPVEAKKHLKEVKGKKLPEKVKKSIGDGDKKKVKTYGIVLRSKDKDLMNKIVKAVKKNLFNKEGDIEKAKSKGKTGMYQGFKKLVQE